MFTLGSNRLDSGLSPSSIPPTFVAQKRLWNNLKGDVGRKEIAADPWNLPADSSSGKRSAQTDDSAVFGQRANLLSGKCLEH